MPTVDQGIEKLKFWQGQGKGSWHIPEPKLMEQEATKRIRNKERAKRIVLCTDEHNFSDFHVWREAYMHTVGNNPTICTQAIIQAMKEFDVKRWYEEEMGEGEGAT